MSKDIPNLEIPILEEYNANANKKKHEHLKIIKEPMMTNNQPENIYEKKKKGINKNIKK